MTRLATACLVAFASLVGPAMTPASAASGDRTLYLYYTHTKETGRFTFKRNGRYDQKVLSELNVFLRDWRRNEPAKMDPRLFDLIWEVYQEVGATQPINIVSAYRSPKTNEMLRATSSGVAENSQHTKGHAMDFFIPGVPLSTLRAVAMKKQVGGVGYYPTSGSPFVHLDTGNVRAWPRMTRTQLAKIFPTGRTLHLPAEGKPLSEEGRRYAMAEWQKCHSVPCNGGGNTRLASNEGNSRSLMDVLFGGDEAKVQSATATQRASTGPVRRQVPTIAVAPVPASRPEGLGGAEIRTASIELAGSTGPTNIPFSTVGSAPLEDGAAAVLIAPIPAQKSPTLAAATSTPTSDVQDAVMAIAALDPPVPAPRTHMTQTDENGAMAAAYAASVPEPGAQQALTALIARETAKVPGTLTPAARTASLGVPAGKPHSLANLMDATWGAVDRARPANDMQAALAAKVARMPVASIKARQTELMLPDLEHVADTMVAPVAMTSGHFADIGEAGEGDFDPATQLGAYATVIDFVSGPDAIATDRFTQTGPSVGRL